MQSTLFVINPNSNPTVTAGIDRALDPLRAADGPAISCLTLEEGPFGIESQRDVDGVVAPLLRRVADLQGKAAGFVVACFSDPGLHAAREATARPVLGIMECGLLTALTLGQRVGIVAIRTGSIPRHRRVVGAMGLNDRLAGDRALGLGVDELADAPRALGRMVEVGRLLKEADGADVLVMGCAGMAGYRAELAAATGLPVVEPVQAAVGMALARVRLGW